MKKIEKNKLLQDPLLLKKVNIMTTEKDDLLNQIENALVYLGDVDNLSKLKIYPNSRECVRVVKYNIVIRSNTKKDEHMYPYLHNLLTEYYLLLSPSNNYV